MTVSGQTSSVANRFVLTYYTLYTSSLMKGYHISVDIVDIQTPYTLQCQSFQTGRVASPALSTKIFPRETLTNTLQEWHPCPVWGPAPPAGGGGGGGGGGGLGAGLG